jgi:hypothetical protein
MQLGGRRDETSVMKARNKIEARVFARLDQLKVDGGLDAVIAYQRKRLAHVMSFTPDSPELEIRTSESENRAVCKWIQRRFGRDIKLERNRRKEGPLWQLMPKLTLALAAVGRSQGDKAPSKDGGTPAYQGSRVSQTPPRMSPPFKRAEGTLSQIRSPSREQAGVKGGRP